MLTVLCAAALTGRGPVVREFEFEGPDDGRRYPARLTVPREPNGATVLLIGGGSAFDIPWTTPGRIESEGHSFAVTLDGRDTHDADRLASALVERGFTVMQWSLIHSEDRIEAGMVKDAVDYPQSVKVTRRALEACREQPGVDGRKIILVGHSLGATRAFAAADEGVIGVVGLAGAYLDRVAKSPRVVVEEMWAAFPGADTDANGALSEAEFAASEAVRGATGRDFGEVDLDGDGVLRGWEVAGAWMTARIEAGEAVLDERAEFRTGIAWPVDVMSQRSELPVLLVCGGLDDLSLHGALIRSRGMAKVEVEFVPKVGHMLGEERGFRFGPMDEAIVRRVSEWAASVVHAAEDDLSAPNVHPEE